MNARTVRKLCGFAACLVILAPLIVQAAQHGIWCAVVVLLLIGEACVWIL
jgi:hypothetical protein